MLIGILIKMSKIVKKEDMDKVLPLVFDFSKIQILIDKENFVNNSIKNYNVRAYIVVVLKLLKMTDIEAFNQMISFIMSNDFDLELIRMSTSNYNLTEFLSNIRKLNVSD